MIHFVQILLLYTGYTVSFLEETRGKNRLDLIERRVISTMRPFFVVVSTAGRVPVILDLLCCIEVNEPDGLW